VHKNVELQQAVHQTNLDDNAPHTAFLQKISIWVSACPVDVCWIHKGLNKFFKKETTEKQHQQTNQNIPPQTNRPPPLKF